MYLPGTPMLWREYGRRQAQLVIYHRGGGLGGRTSKVYLPWEKKILPRQNHNLSTLDNEPLKFDNLIIHSWETVLNPWTKISEEWFRWNTVSNLAQVSLQAHILNMPAVEYWKKCGDLQPVECNIHSSDDAIVNDEGVSIRAVRSTVYMQYPVSPEAMIHYKPGITEEQNLVALTDKIKRIIEEYVQHGGKA